MNALTKPLTEWAIQKITQQYPDDVALLVAVEGHETDNDGHGVCFDYFVPATKRGHTLSQTFILNGIGYDLYPRSWERMERTADLVDPATLCLANATILYGRTKEDEARFYALQERLQHNLQNKPFVYGRALEQLDDAMDLYRTLMFETVLSKVRLAAGHIAGSLLQGIAFLNGSYIRVYTGGVAAAAKLLPQLPEHFLTDYEQIVRATSVEQLRALCHHLLVNARSFIALHRPASPYAAAQPDFQEFAAWYEEMSLHWRRIRYYCAQDDANAAFSDACNLQQDLNAFCLEFGLAEYDLLAQFDAGRLMCFAQDITAKEQQLTEEIKLHGGVIHAYDTLDDFLAHNPTE